MKRAEPEQDFLRRRLMSMIRIEDTIMKTTGRAITLLLFILLTGFAPSSQKEKKEPTPKLKTYYLALLKTGPHRDQDSLTAATIQEAHLANIRRLGAEGKLDIAGPFLDGGDLKGIFIYNVGSLEEADSLAKTDPAVKAGRLIVELHPWMSMPGASLR